MDQALFHRMATEYMYAIPLAMVIAAGYFWFQKTKDKTVKMNNDHILKNAIFVGILVGMFVYFGKPIPLIEEAMHVGPAEF